MVERFVRDEEAVGSNPVTSTRIRPASRVIRGLQVFFYGGIAMDSIDIKELDKENITAAA